MAKYMTIEDLYSFCLKNNFVKFNSNEFGDEIVVRMFASFEKQKNDLNKHTEGMTPFVSRAFHDHINLNKSKIPEESFNENLPSTNLRPILAHIVEDKDGVKDFGSHDFDIEIDEDGNEHYTYYEQPVGVIDGSKTTTEYDEKAKVNRAILYGYLYDGYCQDAIDILNRRGETACSVELTIRNMSFDGANKVLSLDDFYVTGLTLLGEKVKPGMANSNLKIEDFALKNTVTFEQNPDVIKLLQELSDKIDVLSSYTKDSMKGGQNQVNKFEELLQKYNKTVEDITFEYEGLSDEELETAFTEAFEEPKKKKVEDDDVPATPVVEEDSESVPNPESEQDVPVVEPEDDTNDEGGDGNETFSEKFVKQFEISHDDIRFALYNLLSSYEEMDNEWYFIESVYDSHFVYSNWSGDKTFGQNYVKSEDNISFEGDRYELFKELLTSSEKVALEEMRSNYAKFEEISDKLAKYEVEPEKIQILESEEYSSIADKDEFVELKKQENHFDLSVDELKKAADDIILVYAKKGVLNFSANENEKHSVGMKQLPMGKKSSKRSRYGGLGKKES